MPSENWNVNRVFDEVKGLPASVIMAAWLLSLCLNIWSKMSHHMVMATKADSKNFWDLFSTLTVGKFLNKLKKNHCINQAKTKQNGFQATIIWNICHPYAAYARTAQGLGNQLWKMETLLSPGEIYALLLLSQKSSQSIKLNKDSLKYPRLASNLHSQG